MSSCQLGIKNVVEKYVVGKSYLNFNGSDFVQIGNSPKGRVNPKNYWRVAESMAKRLNKAINSDLKLGDIFYATRINDVVGMSIAPTTQQLNLLNARDEAEMVQYMQDWREARHQELLDTRRNQMRRFYQEDIDRGEYEEEHHNEFYQKEDILMSTASPKTLLMIKDFIKRIGVDIKEVDEIVVNGIKQDATAIAILMQKLIQVVNGKDTETLPEEAMHFAVAIIKQKNPALYTKLMNEINGFQLLNDVFTLYGDDPLYQKDGKRNVVKLKEEAIAKVLAETIIKHAEGITEHPDLLAKVGVWWKNIINYFKNLFTKSGFDQAAMDIISGKTIGTVDDIRDNEMFLQKTKQDDIFDKLKEIASHIEKKEDGYYINGVKIPRRVSDLIQDWYSRRFKDKDLSKSEYSIAVDNLKAEKGTAGHAAFEYAFSRFVDEDGYLRTIPLDDVDYDIYNPKFDRAMYQLLKDNLKERLNSFPSGTRFVTEMTIYDAKRGLAGTVDFLAVEPSGKVHILDWKFMGLNTDKYEDIPWYKINAWQNQMNQYKLIIQNVYGVKNEQFGQTRMIPILAKYSEGNAKANLLPKLLSIKIGDVNIKNVKEDYLLPVGLEGEKTGNKKIDILLEKLNAVYRKFSEKKVLPSEKINKAEQLNELFKAIRQLQIKGNLKPLLHQAKVLNKQITRTIQIYNDKFLNKDPKSFSEQEVNDFAKEIQDAQDTLLTYVTLDTDLKSLFIGTLSEEDKLLKEELRNVSDDARDLQITLNDILDDYTADIIVKSVGVDYFLSPEKIIKGITKLFASTATLQLRGIEALYKKANKAFAFSGMDTLTENKRLEQLKNAYETWASGKGFSKNQFFDIIKKKDKNELINEFNSDFYTTLKTKIEEKDIKWIMNNVKISEYNQFLQTKLQEEFDRIDNKVRFGTVEEINREIAREKASIKNLYDTSTITSTGWLLYDFINKFPKDAWQSKEWKELIKPENKAAKDFYDYIRERNEMYQQLGYIGKYESRIFLPFVRKSLTEKLITGGQVRLGEQFFRSISIDEGDIGYGKSDPLTGKPINVIPKYFVNEIEGEVSSDLFRTMSFYNEAAIRYKYLSEIEDQVRAIVAVEKNKKAIATSIFGKTEYKDGEIQYTPDNTENSKLVEDMMKAIIYGQRYITSETFDQLLGKLGTWGETFNKKLGIKVFPEDMSDKQVSINKIITQLNNTFQLSTLGLNLLSASSNLFGGNSHSLINAGKYFTKTDYIAAEAMMFMNKFNGTDQKKMIGALEYFLPLTENYNRELAKHLSINNLTSESLQDGLMYLMRKSDWNVQTANFYAYLRNTIVDDGEVKNVREFLKSQEKYSSIYAGTTEQRKALEEQFEKDVIALIEEKGILKVAQVVDDKFIIPGVDQKSDSVVELRRKVQQISKDALGNLSEDDLRTINMQIYGKSFMIFKNWIPRLVDVRMGNLKYNSASDAYEWGRMRMIYRVISEDLLGSLSNLSSSLMATEKGVDFMRELYEKKKTDYENDTGKVLEMTEDEFIDLVRKNIKSQLLDVIFLTTMFILILGLKAGAPDKDEYPAIKSQYNFMLRAADKFRDELMYFYDPTSIQGLISKGIFPSMSLLENFTKGTKNFFIENWALATGDEKKVKSNQVIKYWMKVFPIANQTLSYLPMFYPELAKDLGVKIQSNYGIR